MKLSSATHLQRTGAPGRGVEVELEGRRLRLTNLDKAMYPATGFTKGQVIDYYVRVAPLVLPHAAHRPLTLKRFPDGVGGAYFFEKQCPRYRPDWIETIAIWIESFQTTYEYCAVSDAASLAWLANLANLELHVALARGQALRSPTAVVFDLDPGHPATVLDACEVALVLHGLFERLGLASWVKSSGSKGLHVYVPLNTPVTYAETKAFARDVAETIARRFPAVALADISRARRAGRVLIDWGQNDRHKTMVAPYSLRAGDAPTVSLPLRWEEIEVARERGDAAALTPGPERALARAEAEGELFAAVATLEQRLPAL